MSIIQAAVAWLIIVIMSIIIAVVINDDRSVMGFTEAGECVWIREAPNYDKRVCPLVLPVKYEHVYVHYNDKVGE